MKRHFAWLYKEPEPTNETEEARVERMRKLVWEIEAELERMRLADLEAIEKPVGKYRIIKVERADASCGEDGYYVQAWSVKQYGWQLSYKAHRVCKELDLDITRGSRLPFSWYLERALEWTWGNIPDRDTSICWYNVGSANPHATYEDAAEWLRKWIRPEVEEVYFNEAGEPVEKAA